VTRPVPTYRSYLGLDELMAGVQPLSSADDSGVFAEEHLFVVTHQATELWLKQVLVDLDRAVVALAPSRPDVPAAARYTARAAHVVDVMAQGCGVLVALDLPAFRAFRSGLGTASGGQSSQFADLRRALGLGDTESALMTRLRDLAERSGATLAGLTEGRAGSPLQDLGVAMGRLAEAHLTWQTVHLEIVARALGGSAGTGGTSGHAYLSARVERAFPELAAPGRGQREVVGGER
jgi:tryptophan 2,3-dioxygenase